MMATASNLALALLFIWSTPKVSAQSIPALHEGVGGVDSVCLDTVKDGSCSQSQEATNNITIEEAIQASDDPNLNEMPNHDFKAYVRPDVSSFYKEKPGSRKPSSHAFSGLAGKFINMTPDRLNLYW